MLYANAPDPIPPLPTFDVLQDRARQCVAARAAGRHADALELHERVHRGAIRQLADALAFLDRRIAQPVAVLDGGSDRAATEILRELRLLDESGADMMTAPRDAVELRCAHAARSVRRALSILGD